MKIPPKKITCKLPEIARSFCKWFVAKKQKAVECGNCGFWVHIKYNKINIQTYKYLKKESCAWYCISCSGKAVPFSNLNEDDFS